MDTQRAIASKRDVRAYADRPIAPEVARRILDAGRLAGSARNGQPWRFVVPQGGVRQAVAQAVYVPHHIHTAGLVVAVVVTPSGGLVDMDAGRAAQNMMLAAWNEGVGSCPNGVADAPAMAAALGLEAEERVPIVLSFGYPARPADPDRRTVERWSATAARRPLDDVVEYLGGSA